MKRRPTKRAPDRLRRVAISLQNGLLADGPSVTIGGT